MNAFLQRGDHLIITNLTKIAKELTDCHERVGSVQADHLIHLFFDPLRGIGRRNADPHDQPGRSLCPDKTDRRQQGRTGGDTVIHQDDDPAFGIGRRTAVALPALANNL